MRAFERQKSSNIDPCQKQWNMGQWDKIKGTLPYEPRMASSRNLISYFACFFEVWEQITFSKREEKKLKEKETQVRDCSGKHLLYAKIILIRVTITTDYSSLVVVFFRLGQVRMRESYPFASCSATEPLFCFPYENFRMMGSSCHKVWFFLSHIRFIVLVDFL